MTEMILKRIYFHSDIITLPKMAFLQFSFFLMVFMLTITNQATPDKINYELMTKGGSSSVADAWEIANRKKKRIIADRETENN
jgi:hypothetical protein